MKTSLTDKQGLALSILAYAIESRRSTTTNAIHFHQVDILTEDGDNEEGKPEVWEKGKTHGEVVGIGFSYDSSFLRIKASYHAIITRGEFEECIEGRVEAKMRIFREGSGEPWRLHYLMFMFPHIHPHGCIPRLYIEHQFANPEFKRKAEQAEGRIFTRYHTARYGDPLDEGLFRRRLTLIMSTICR